MRDLLSEAGHGAVRPVCSLKRHAEGLAACPFGDVGPQQHGVWPSVRKAYRQAC